MGGIIDIAAFGVLALAVLRGVWIGVVREVFSLAALAAAILAFRTLREPVAAELAARTPWNPLVATAVAGGIVVVAALLLVTLVGALVRRLVDAAGLGLLDRIGGAVVGALEGTIVIAMALLAATEVLGPKDPLLVGSRAVAVFQRARGEEAPHHPATGAALPAVPRS